MASFSAIILMDPYNAVAEDIWEVGRRLIYLINGKVPIAKDIC
jgi:hypothetical protein